MPDCDQSRMPYGGTRTQSTGEVTLCTLESKNKGATKSGMNSRQQTVQGEIDSANKVLKRSVKQKKLKGSIQTSELFKVKLSRTRRKPVN